ncbi:MAG TPA: metallophosphoesterase [Patescibacteria group bacterium]|nr:metallophosphoesterase [Patescibacteria group bacterium]
MKIISFSDIHLEYPKDLKVPQSDADLLVLSGDILNMHQPEPLRVFLNGWTKPVIYVAGNHEYYDGKSMTPLLQGFRQWLRNNLPQVTLLDSEAAVVHGVNFFGGTMWTDFAGGDENAMAAAAPRMHDYKLIHTDAGRLLTPQDTVPLHEAFTEKLVRWLETPLRGPRVVITHHAPCEPPDTIHKGSPLTPAFNSFNMLPLIEKYQPDLWFYGHTHECDRQKIGRTQVISNQLGYVRNGQYECEFSFDPGGALVEVG